MKIINYLKKLFGCVQEKEKTQNVIIEGIEQFKYGITHEDIIKKIDELVKKGNKVKFHCTNSYSIEGIAVTKNILNIFTSYNNIYYHVSIKTKSITTKFNNPDDRLYVYLETIYNKQLEEKDIEEGYKLKEYLKTGVYPTVVSPEDIWNEKKIDSVKTAINAHAATQSEERILTNQLLSNQYKLEDNIQYDSTQINP